MEVGPVEAGGRVGLRVNNTTGAVSDTILLNGNEINIDFQSTDVFEVSVSDLSIAK